nr:retrovirus-related Pol polyprotein from transposon TNT 1-94 [Tanacetum cinerariifolium]
RGVTHNVRYIPELKRNLISLGTVEKVGYTVKLQSGKVKVINGSMVILSGIQRDNCVYSLDGHAMAGEINASVEEKDNLAQVWHKRLGHISEARLQTYGVRLRWNHWELRGISYLLLMIIPGGMIKKLRTYHGLEFYNQKFEQLCIKSEITRHLTVVGTPQQNEVAERMNRTLMDKVRCLLIQSGLPKTFWAEATCTAAYVINRIFGCVAYPHDKQGKLELRAIKYVLLGYPEGVKGYRLYMLDDESPKIVTSRNVVFNESVMYKDTWKDSGAGADKSTWELVNHPTGQKPVSCKWLFKIKEGIEGVQKPRYKARLVARGFTQGADDMLIACKSKDEIGSTKYLLKKEFNMKELEEAKKILDMEIVRDQSRKILRVSQSGYVFKILNSFRIDNGKSVKMSLGGNFKLSLKDCSITDCDVERMSKVPYANAVGSLMLDVKWNLKYLWGTANVGLVYGTNHGNHVDVTYFVDSDYAKDPDKELIPSSSRKYWLAYIPTLQAYLGENPLFPTPHFEERFRISRKLFTSIVDEVTIHCAYFFEKQDCIRKLGISLLLKCTSAIHQLAYDTVPDALNEYLQMGHATARLSLEQFCTSVMSIFGLDFLRKPTISDIEKLYACHEEKHKLPRMLGSLYCTDREWFGCPIAHKVQYCRHGHGPDPFILL